MWYWYASTVKCQQAKRCLAILGLRMLSRDLRLSVYAWANQYQQEPYMETSTTLRYASQDHVMLIPAHATSVRIIAVSFSSDEERVWSS
jgi:hypothetical protein